MMKQVVNRLKSTLARGIIHLVQDEGGRQFCQVTVLSGEVKNRVERIQSFGFSSVPPSGTAAIIAFMGADRGKPVIIGDNDPAARFNGQAPGESAQYDAFDQHIVMRQDGSIEIQTGGNLIIKSAEKIRMETALLEVTGEIIDRAQSGGQSMADMRAVFNTHTHNENDAHNHGPTASPNQTMGAG